MPELFLVNGGKKPKAKNDNIFLLKESITDICYLIEKTRKMGFPYIELLKNHECLSFAKGRIRRFYYDMLQTIEFDKEVEFILKRHAIDQKEDYYKLRIDDEILDKLNKKIKPNIISAPFYYDQKYIRSLHTGHFIARFDKDCFDHSTMILKKEGMEYCFGCYDTRTQYYPVFTRPYLDKYPTEEVNERFLRFQTRFQQSYTTMKGLFFLWYGYKF